MSAAPQFMQIVTPRWGDMDAYGHVNNAAFFVYFEECRVQWLASLQDDWMTAAHGPVIASATVNYREQLQWPQPVHIELNIERIGTTSMHINHRMVSSTDPTSIYADARVVLVWIDRKSGKPVPVPAVYR